MVPEWVCSLYRVLLQLSPSLSQKDFLKSTWPDVWCLWKYMLVKEKPEVTEPNYCLWPSPGLLQYFDAVGWMTGGAYGLWKIDTSNPGSLYCGPGVICQKLSNILPGNLYYQQCLFSRTPQVGRKEKKRTHWPMLSSTAWNLDLTTRRQLENEQISVVFLYCCRLLRSCVECWSACRDRFQFWNSVTFCASIWHSHDHCSRSLVW